MSVDAQANQRGRTFSVVVNVDQRLLHDTEQRRLHLLRQAVERRWEIEVHLDAAPFRKSRRVPP